MVKPYVPNRGDVIQINFDPTKGHEQAKTRPALVLSPTGYNKKASLLICCPITSKIKGYPFEVEVTIAHVDGVVLADQVRTLDWQARGVTKLTRVNQQTLDLVCEKLLLLIKNPQ